MQSTEFPENALRCDCMTGSRTTPRLTVLCPYCHEPVRVWQKQAPSTASRTVSFCPACSRQFVVTISVSQAPANLEHVKPLGCMIQKGRAIRLDRLRIPREARPRKTNRNRRGDNRDQHARFVDGRRAGQILANDWRQGGRETLVCDIVEANARIIVNNPDSAGGI